MRNSLSFQGICCLLLLGGAISGCGSGTDADLASVEGTVTFDGKPLPDARIVFEPDGGGLPSEGMTDENGRYKLHYTGSRSGAKLGTHVVRIRTSGLENGAKEIIPVQYNAESKLKETVAEGSNTINFTLKPGGKIVDVVDDGEGGEDGDSRGNPENP